MRPITIIKWRSSRQAEKKLEEDGRYNLFER